MRVRLLFFASYRDLAGQESLELDVPAGADAEHAVDLVRRNGALAALPARPAIAINERFATLGTLLVDGDEIALLPPVAGG